MIYPGTNQEKSILTSLLLYGHPRYRDIFESLEIQLTLAEELELFWGRANDAIDQMNVSTATWALDHYEKETGIVVSPSKPRAERISVIHAKYRGSGTTTEEFIQQTAEAFANGEVSVEDRPAESLVVISFVGVLGVPPNINDFTKMLRDIIPAHYDFDLVYTYLTYGELFSTYADYGALAATGLTYDQILNGGA